MIETLIDPNVSIILAELEDGPKDSIHMKEKLHMPVDEIQEKISYVIQHGFVQITHERDKTIFTANTEKLNKIMESDENFSGVVDGLTKLDSFLN